MAVSTLQLFLSADWCSL